MYEQAMKEQSQDGVAVASVTQSTQGGGELLTFHPILTLMPPLGSLKQIWLQNP